MGRRSINTTKSGKYMNPTDQARKEARKRELKKNKKQRQMVRAAVLKGKDPVQLIGDMEKIDEMEFNVNNPPLLNEKVLKDKRKKLKETWDRVMRLYFKEDRERYTELKKLELEYEARRSLLMKYFESVRITQQVQIDEIPMPDAPQAPAFMTSQIPLPSEIEAMRLDLMMPQSILKKSQVYVETAKAQRKAPGIPPGPIPDLSSDEDDEIDTALYAGAKESVEAKLAKARKIRFADEDATEKDKDEAMDSMEAILSLDDIPMPGSSVPPPRLPQGHLGASMLRPPPLRTNIPPPPRMLPPGIPPPPPGRPTLPPPGIPLRLGNPPIRLPPGPPPGIPPLRMIRPPSGPPPRISSLPMIPSAGVSAVLSAPPSLMQRPRANEDEGQKGATIEAKPQIRNLSADVMRFTPTTLRVKREDRHKKGGTKGGVMFDQPKDNYSSADAMLNQSISKPTKDDAYQQFLQEMESLL